MERDLLIREVDYLQEAAPKYDNFFASLPSIVGIMPSIISAGNNWDPMGNGGVVAFPSGQTLKITSGDTGANGKHYDPLHSKMPLLDVSGTNYEKYLSKSFQAKEFLKFGSSAAYEKKYKIKPDTSILRLDPMLVYVLQLLRDYVNKAVNITSGYRHFWYNEILPGSADSSQHLIGRATDIKIDGMTPLEVAKAAIDVAGSYIFGIGVYSTFTHIDVRIGNFSTWQNDQQEIKNYRAAKNLSNKNTRSFSVATSVVPTTAPSNGMVNNARLLESAFANGEKDENKLTNILFYANYPSLNGQKLKSNDPLAKEWVEIRDTYVRPFLKLKQVSTTANGNSITAIPPLGKLQVDTSVPQLSKAISSYQFTSDDALWLARFVEGEAGGRNTPENHAVIYAVLNRYGAFRHLSAAKGWGSFGNFIRKYSTTLQPILNSVGAAKRVWKNHLSDAIKYPVVKGIGNYEGTNIQKVQYLKHIKHQQKQWNSFSTVVQYMVVNILTGKIPNPGIGIASDFGSTYVYYKDNHGRYPSDTEWVAYTIKHAKEKNRIWVGQLPGIDQKKNAFFIDNRLKNIPPNSIRVI